MKKPYHHSRREIIQYSFPNNKLSTRTRKRKVVKRETIEDDLTIYSRFPASAISTPYDLPNPTDNAPSFSDYWLRAGDWGDGQEVSGITPPPHHVHNPPSCAG